MATGNGMFERMCREAQHQVASGDQGWKDTDTNTLLLACFGMLADSMSSKITKPLWFFASAIAAGVVGYLVNLYTG